MPESVHEALKEIAGQFDPDAWGAEDAVLQFNLTGEGGGEFIARIEGDSLEIEEGTAESPKMTMTCSAEDFLAMISGDLNAVSAFMAGQLKIDGEMALALKLQNLLGA
jgi:putative sterol carrier protein